MHINKEDLKMLTLEQMKKQVSKCQLSFDEENKEVWITKGTGQTNWVQLSYDRAIEWINVGIDDIDCRSKEEMLKLLNSWK